MSLSLQLLAAGLCLLQRDSVFIYCSDLVVQHHYVHHGCDPNQKDESQQAISKQSQLSAGLEGGGQSHRPLRPDVGNKLYFIWTRQRGPDIPVHPLQHFAG